MSILFLLAWRGHITARNPTGVTVVSWYWHFVDGVWVVVFTLVYLIGR
jgi:cytochrome c oxidase subunit 3/cytochrome o ubiquinol oxidase subunit 3